MKNKKYWLMISFCCLFMFNINVKATTILKDDVKPNTYIIGKYMYTRDSNSDYDYDGVLTTEKIMLASQTVDGNLNDMIIYRKNLFGNWVNGMTGAAIVPPDSFEIVNRNLHDLLDKPNLSCYFPNSNENADEASCHTYLIGNREVIEPNQENASLKFSEEYYKIVDSNSKGVLDVRYIDGNFYDLRGNKLQVIKVDEEENISFDENLAVVSRIYFEDEALDGTQEKIYSDYSNVKTNAFQMSNISEDELPTLKAKIVPVGLDINGKKPKDVKFYNVEFSFEGLDTTKYLMSNYKVYSNTNEDNIGSFISDLYNHPDMSVTYDYLWTDNLVSDKYFNPFYIPNFGYGYLADEEDGYNIFGEIEDISSKKGHSIRLDKNDGTIDYIAEVTICTIGEFKCYDTIINNKVSASKTYNVSFELEDGTNIGNQVVTENDKVVIPENPTKDGYVFTNWTLNETAFDFDTPVTTDLTLVANFRALYNYTVTFNSDGGSAISNQTVIEGNKIIKPENPTKNGYNFDKWVLNNQEFDFNTIIDNDIELTATWIQKNYVVRKSRVDSFSPDLTLTVYEDEEEIAFREIVVDDYILCMGNVPKVNESDLTGITNLTIVLTDGTRVSGVIAN